MADFKHIDETILELYTLNSPSVAGERDAIKAHLKECRGCRELYDNIADFYTTVNNDLTSSVNLPMPKPVEIPAKRIYSIEQKYQDLSPIHRFAVGIPLRLARWVFHHPYVAAGSTVFFSSLIIAALINFFKPAETKPRDLNPTNVKFAGEMMLAMNRWGEVVDTELVGTRFAQSQKDYEVYGETHLVKYYDINHDGVNEIIWGQQPWDKTQGNSIIFCKSVVEKRILWSDTVKRALSFVSQSISENKFLCVKILVDDFGNSGRPEVVVVAKHDYFPSLIQKLNGSDGRLLSEYLHIGGIEDVVAKDINHDGRKEILICGINNSYRLAFVTVCDPRFMSGHSPLTSAYKVRNYQPGTEIYYLLIPKTVIGNFRMSRTGWNRAISLTNFNDEHEMFRLNLDESIAEGASGFSIYMGYDLVPRTYETGDLFDLIINKLVKEKKIPSVLDSTYWAKYSKKIKYWNGETWENHPVQNNRYIDALKKLQLPS